MPGAGTDKTKNWTDLPGPAVVLVEPQLGENIGAAARVMANFGLSRLRLVNPRDGWPNIRPSLRCRRSTSPMCLAARSPRPTCRQRLPTALSFWQPLRGRMIRRSPCSVRTRLPQCSPRASREVRPWPSCLGESGMGCRTRRSRSQTASSPGGSGLCVAQPGAGRRLDSL
jgi:hypothetical protein